MERRAFLAPDRVGVEVQMSPRTPPRLRGLMYVLPALCNIVDAMDGAPFRFYFEDLGNLRWQFTAEKAA